MIYFLVRTIIESALPSSIQVLGYLFCHPISSTHTVVIQLIELAMTIYCVVVHFLILDLPIFNV